MDAASKQPASDSAAAGASQPGRRRRWIFRTLLGLLVVGVGCVAALPSLISWFPALRNLAIREATGDVNGDVTVESLSVGWFEPLTVGKVVVTPRQGGRSAPWGPAIKVERIEADRGLWSMLMDPHDLGSVRIERPEVFVEVEHGTSNFAYLFPKPAATAGEPKPVPTLPDIGAKVRIVDGRFRFVSDGTHPWEINGINLGAGLTAASRSKSGRPEATIEHGTLVAHQQLTVGMCDDVLKYVAPNVAEAAYVKGDISIELDDWRLPLGDIASGDLGGRLVMHSVETGPGPLTSRIHRALTSLPIINNWKRDLALPKFVQIAQESTVPFKMVPGGRIYHQDLRFSIVGLVTVGTHGTVGLDQTLDLTAEFGIHPPNPEERVLAVLRQLTDTPWPVNIRGTLSAPEIDLSPLAKAGWNLAFEKIPADIESGRDSLGSRAFRALQDLGVPVQPDDLRRLGNLIEGAQTPSGTGGAPAPRAAASGTGATPGAPVAPAAQAQQPVDPAQVALDIVGELLRRRQQQQAQRQAGGQNPGALENRPPPVGPLRGLFRNGPLRGGPYQGGPYPGEPYQGGPYPGGPYGPNPPGASGPNPPGASGPSPDPALQELPAPRSVAPSATSPGSTTTAVPPAAAYGAQPYGPDVPPLEAPAAAGTSPGAPAIGGPPAGFASPSGQPSGAPYAGSGGPFGPPPPYGPPPRRPLLRKGLGLLRDTIQQALETPPPAPPPPAPSPTTGTPSATPSATIR